MKRTILALLAVASLPLAAPAQDQVSDYDVTNLYFRGAGVMVYAALPARSEVVPAVQLRVDLGEVAPSLRVVPAVTYWSSEYQESELEEVARRVEALCERGGSPCPGIDLGDVRIADLSLEVDAQYLWTTSVGFEPYTGAGVGLHLLNGSGDLIRETFVEDILDGITPGVNVHAGVELPLGALRLHGELRGTLAGSASWLGAGLGGVWHVTGGR